MSILELGIVLILLPQSYVYCFPELSHDFFPLYFMHTILFFDFWCKMLFYLIIKTFLSSVLQVLKW